MNRPKPAQAQLEQLWQLATTFIDEQQVSCPDAVYQRYNVIEHAYEFIEGAGALVGWHEWEDE